MNEHTKEPWYIRTSAHVHPGGNTSCLEIVGDNGAAVTCGEWEGGIPPEREANAERIVACVNALAGYEPGAVGELVAAAKDAHAALENITTFEFELGKDAPWRNRLGNRLLAWRYNEARTKEQETDKGGRDES